MEAPRARGHRPSPLSSFSKGPHSSPLPPPSWRDRPEKSTDLFSLREALLLAQVLLSKHQVSNLKGSEPRSGLTWEKPSVLQLLASKQNPERSQRVRANVGFNLGKAICSSAFSEQTESRAQPNLLGHCKEVTVKAPVRGGLSFSSHLTSFAIGPCVCLHAHVGIHHSWATKGGVAATQTGCPNPRTH